MSEDRQKQVGPQKVIWASDEERFPAFMLLRCGDKIQLMERQQGRNYVSLLDDIDLMDCVVLAHQVLLGEVRRGSMEKRYLQLAAGMMAIIASTHDDPDEGLTLVPGDVIPADGQKAAPDFICEAAE